MHCPNPTVHTRLLTAGHPGTCAFAEPPAPPRRTHLHCSTTAVCFRGQWCEKSWSKQQARQLI